MVGDLVLLTHQLIEPAGRHLAPAIGIDIGAVIRSWRPAIDGDAEADRMICLFGRQDEMQIASMEAIADAALGIIHGREFLADGPGAIEAPPVERQVGYRLIEMRLIGDNTIGRAEMAALAIA